MGVHFQIYCGCGAFPAADPVVSAARPCSDAMGRDMKSTTLLHARLATVSLRAFDRDSGSFTLVVDHVAATDTAETGPEAEAVTVAFLPSEYISSRPAGLAEYEEFLSTASPGTALTFVGRWLTRSWLSRSGDLREVREFEATRMAHGHHDRATLCGPLPDGPTSCPALAARQLMEASLATARATPSTRPPAATPPCSTPPRSTPPHGDPVPPAAPELLSTENARATAPFAPGPGRLPSRIPAALSAIAGARLLGIGPKVRVTLSPPTAPAATLTPCARTDTSLPTAAQGQPCRTPGCCQTPGQG